ncbi:IS607 family transposase [Niallia endozanthoxylica]|uniref:IS607 family transposase n=1 Tax=Niallia endozanthoxylica TaxID=2036016 RepID=A0A5J5HRX9_9BACI|nr:IS607 family transposase [Niallia endozanthoxylica]KAA9023870.1 IS607 family transposase [Niallia endozanthoxylica]
MDKLLLMKEATKLLGFTTKTIQRWDNEGKIRIIRTPGGRRRIPLSEVERLMGKDKTSNVSNRKITIYARVSSSEQKQKGDLERQVNFLKEKVESNFSTTEVITDVGSGLNDKRKGLLKLMELAKNQEITDIAIRYKDRLTRFGYGYLEEYFDSHHVTIHVFDDDKTNKTVQEELADDLISIISSFSGKLYGLSSKKHQELKKTFEETIVDVQNLSNENKERTNRSFK